MRRGRRKYGTKTEEGENLRVWETGVGEGQRG